MAAMDVLAPKIGEIVGGSQREERLEVLQTKIQEMDLPAENYEWYLDSRRFGTAPHAGFGLGFERVIQFATGMANIRDVIPFPRTPGERRVLMLNGLTSFQSIAVIIEFGNSNHSIAFRGRIMDWQEVMEHPCLQDLPFKIELNEFGKIENDADFCASR